MIDWTTIENIDISSYFTIPVQTPITRAFITTFGKIGFINIAFSPTNNLNGSVIQLPDSLGIKPLYTIELTVRVGEGDIRRGVFTESGGHTFISANQHASSAGKFVAIYGMVFLQ